MNEASGTNSSLPAPGRTPRCFACSSMLIAADIFRRRLQILNGQEIGAGRSADVPPNPRDHPLGGGQVAGRQQRQRSLAITPEAVHLAVGADVIRAGVGTRIGGEHEALVDAYCQAVGHSAFCLLHEHRAVNGKRVRHVRASQDASRTSRSTAPGSGATSVLSARDDLARFLGGFSRGGVVDGGLPRPVGRSCPPLSPTAPLV